LNTNRILYLPIEIKARELHGKSFLAARAIERGWIVVTGEQSEVHRFMRRSPPGAYIEISIPPPKAARLEKLYKSGHRIANLCEESLNYVRPQDYCDRKLGAAALPWVDRLLVLGAVNADHIRQCRADVSEKIAVVGNPRFDTLTPGLRAIYDRKTELIRKQFGRFLLVNTNFGRSNPQRRDSDIVASLKRRGMLADQQHEDFIVRQVDYRRRQMAGLQRMLEKLQSSRVVDRIVIRPHPVENHDVWREWAAPLGIDVAYDGTANEWMLAAEAVLHPGCTTGIEGLLLDRSVYSFVPEPNSEFLNPSDSVSEHVADPADLIESLRELHAMTTEQRTRKLTEQQSKLARYVSNVKPPFAADRILDVLETFDLPRVGNASLAFIAPVFSRASAIE
jgi:surface carbohydrate biosynthesis protein